MGWQHSSPLIPSPLQVCVGGQLGGAGSPSSLCTHRPPLACTKQQVGCQYPCIISPVPKTTAGLSEKDGADLNC